VKTTTAGLLVLLTFGAFDSIPDSFPRQTAPPKRYLIRGTTPTCPTCSINAVKLTSIGADEGAEVLTPGSVDVDQRGRTVALNMNNQYVVFDSAGQRLAIFGRKGRGPGEFDGVQGKTFGAADTLYVFMPGLGRVGVVSPDYQFVRTVPFPPIPTSQFVALGDDRFVLAATATFPTADRRRETLADPLHLVSEGSIVRSFGTDSLPTPGSVEESAEKSRFIGPSTRGRIWSAHFRRYVIERWDTAGTLELSIVREVEWFPIVRATYQDPMLVRPHPSQTGVWEDSEGRVWTLIRVADAKWRARPPVKPSTLERGSIGRTPAELQDSLYDSIIEVFDPKRGVLLASRRFPQDFTRAGRGFLYSKGASPDGASTKKIWRIRMDSARPVRKGTPR
jgi:hypothetical protein